VQLDRIEELIERKRQIFGWYQDRLAGCPVALNVELPGDRVTYWMVTAVFETMTTAGRATAALADANISSRPFFPPLSSLPAFADASDAARAGRANPVSYDLAGRALNLPSALTLDEGQVDRVCSVVRRGCALEPGDG
jgi:perosamine synthetase